MEPINKAARIEKRAEPGEGDLAKINAQTLRELGADITGDPHMDIREYIRDMADCLAAADLVICNLLLKNMVARVRPCDLNPAVQLLIARPSDFSFPSGHTAAAFTSVFSLYRENNWLWKPVLVLAAVIAFSRMYLYVHFPTDILGGVAVGWVCALAGQAVSRRLFPQA